MRQRITKEEYDTLTVGQQCQYTEKTEGGTVWFERTSVVCRIYSDKEDAIHVGFYDPNGRYIAQPFNSEAQAKEWAICQGFTHYLDKSSEPNSTGKLLERTAECLFNWIPVFSTEWRLKTCYKKASALENTIKQELLKRVTPDPKFFPALRVLVTQLAEYEHGTANVKDINSRLTLNTLSMIYEDLALAMIHNV